MMVKPGSLWIVTMVADTLKQWIGNSAAYDIENDNFRIRACNPQRMGYLSFEDTGLDID
jgi:hypothetical protein